MPQTANGIETEALKLPRGERAKIALRLLDSLESERQESSADIERAWIEESVRRLEAYRRGEMEVYPAEDVIAELEKPAR